MTRKDLEELVEQIGPDLYQNNAVVFACLNIGLVNPRQSREKVLCKTVAVLARAMDAYQRQLQDVIARNGVFLDEVDTTLKDIIQVEANKRDDA